MRRLEKGERIICFFIGLMLLCIPVRAQVWANNGEDKVTQDELRASAAPAAILNSIWNGTHVSLFGARNEVVGFNLVIEAPGADRNNVRVVFNLLTGPGGAGIASRPASGDGLFDWTGRNIELFYVRYLQIRGLSRLGYENYYDERHVPERLRRPHDGRFAVAGTGWIDRPDHDKFYPDIAVPLEAQGPFTIAAGTNQSIWCDITIPRTAVQGLYTGTMTVTADGMAAINIPVELQVRNFTLPDIPASRTMLYMGDGDVNERYLGPRSISPGHALFGQSIEIINRHFLMAHRHRISLIGADGGTIDRMDDAWTSRLDGSLFTAANGYDGPGAGVGNNVYSIGTYGGWVHMWDPESEPEMRSNTDAWVNWFDARAFVTPTDSFLYLIDESSDYARQERWAQWINANPGPGSRLFSLATISLPRARDHVPSLDIPCSPSIVGITDIWQSAADQVLADSGKRLFFYNGHRPVTGSFMTEDDGVSLRMIPWGQYKKGIQRWFYWESTYYVNFQAYGYSDPRARANLFRQAQTFGAYSTDDAVQGRTGWNYSNGDGVMFYPGTDVLYPEDSYGLMGPIASLRLKHWRRGIQDADYIFLAREIDPVRTEEIVSRMIPKFLWEFGVENPGDPTYLYSDISWSTDPDVWEAARAELADIIESETAIPQTIPLDAGWNWISFNVLPDDRSLDAVFGGILGQVEQVKSQTRSAIRSGGAWEGDLQNMDGIPAGEMFKVKAGEACTLNAQGVRIAADTPILLNAGWNWVAFYPETALPIGQALDSIKNQILEVKSRTQSATFNGTTWSGTLTQLQPGQGYSIRMSDPGALIYPDGR